LGVTYLQRDRFIMSRLLPIDRLQLLAGILWIATQLPFLTSAFRIDDTYFLAVTRHIYQHPLDPYGFQINWDGKPEWAFKTLANPPLVPAYLAAWHCLFPWSEVSFHLAVLPFSLTALFAFGSVARNFGVEPLTAQVLLCCSPAFFLGSQVIMQDVPMLSFFLLAVSSAMLYESQGTSATLTVSFLAAFCCPLAKYNGLVLVPVLLGLVLAGNRKRGLVAIACAPLVALLFWSCFTWFRYGQNHFLAMAAFEKNPMARAPFWEILVGTLAATGLGVLPLCLLDFMRRVPKWDKTLWASAVVILPSVWGFGTSLGYGKSSSLLLAISVWLALQLIGLALLCGWNFYRRKQITGLILVAWMLCGLVFQAGLLFSSVRYVLFIGPPAILLVLGQSSRFPRKRTLGFLVGVNLLLIVIVAIGDSRLASGYREIVVHKVRLWRTGQQGKFYFSGHWGFQYYSEQLGGESVDETAPPVLKLGDLMVVAKTAWPDVLRPRAEEGQKICTTVIQFNPHWLVRTVDCQGGANFYASRTYGCRHPTFLPFGFSRGPGETFLVHQVQHANESAGCDP
jgi:hypothetical protein